jgi:hypothetical protein
LPARANTANGHVFDDVHARWQTCQALIQAHQQVIDLGGFARGFIAGHFAQCESVLLALVTEDDTVAAVSVLNAGHRIAAPMSPQRCYQFVTNQPWRAPAGVVAAPD